MRIGPRMAELQAIVSAMPGCSRRAALRAAELPERGIGHGRPLNRAIQAGLIIQDISNPWVRRGHYALFANERDRVIFNLRAELLRGSPTPSVQPSWPLRSRKSGPRRWPTTRASQHEGLRGGLRCGYGPGMGGLRPRRVSIHRTAWPRTIEPWQS